MKRPQWAMRIATAAACVSFAFANPPSAGAPRPTAARAPAALPGQTQWSAAGSGNVNGNTNANGNANGNTNGNLNENGNINGTGTLGACCFADGTCELLTQIDCEGFCPGDMNCDGAVNFADIDPFVLALAGESVYLGQHPNCRWLNADTNFDGAVNFADIDPFVARLAMPCPDDGVWLGGGTSCGQCAGGNGNANGNANGNVNGNANGNANGNLNGNANGNLNGNANGNVNGNQNGNANSNVNGNANGNLNGNVNGNVNGNANGNVNGNQNGNANGNVNGNQNGNANSNVNGNANGNQNGNVNGNANGNLNGNVNGNANGNVNGNANGNANGNLNGNANGNVNGNGNNNGSGAPCPDGSTQLFGVLTGGSRSGEAEYDAFPSLGCKEFRVRVEGFSPGAYQVFAAGALVGTLNVSGNGQGELRYRTSDGTFPTNFPALLPGDIVSVGGLVSGSLFADCSGSGC